MKLTVDPMPALRAAAKAKVNAHFNNLAKVHVDAAHAMKRAAVAAGSFPAWFVQEAELRGITVDDLASLIASKPDDLMDRELERQRAMASIELANTSADLDAIVDNLIR